MKVAVQFCEERIASSIIRKFSDEHADEYADESILSIVQDLAPKQNDTFVHCKFLNRDTDCSRIFTPIFTEVGLCYTFNSLNMREMVTNQWVKSELKGFMTTNIL